LATACNKAVFPDAFGPMTAVTSPAKVTVTGLAPKLRNPEMVTDSILIEISPRRPNQLQVVFISYSATNLNCMM
jgi:hypothetical protein